MSRQLQAIASPAPRSSTGRSMLVIGLFGMLPLGAVSGLMLMQIFGVWAY
jgi:hypothetical protein